MVRFLSLRDRLAQNTEENAFQVKETLKKLQSDEAGKKVNGKYRNIEILKRARLSCSESTLSRFLGKEGVLLNNEDHRRLVHLLYDEGVFTKPAAALKQQMVVDDPLFYSLVDFLRIGSGSVERACYSFPGTYKLWRHSLYWPGHYVLGALEVIQEKNQVLKVRKTWRFSGSDSTEPLIITSEGYLFQEDGKGYVLLRQQNNQSMVQFIIISNYSCDNDGKVAVMDGMVIGSFMGKTFSTKLYIERWADPPEDDVEFYNAIDIVKPDDVPPFIRNRLDDIKLNDGYITI